MSRLQRWLPVVVIGVIAGATLFPTGDETQTGASCLLCGTRSLADAFLNILLFMPLGAVIAYRRASFTRALPLAFLVSAMLEIAQIFVPGRDATVSDVLFNTLGATAGWLLFIQRDPWLHPTERRARWLAIMSLLGALAVIAIGGVLAQPELPRTTYYGQWTPRFANLEHYGGQVVDARLGDIRIPGLPVRRSAELRKRILDGAELQVKALVGPAPNAFAPIFNLYDDRQREVLTVGADRADLVFRYRARAAPLRFDQPLLRVRGALTGVAIGDTLNIGLRRIGNGYCVRINRREACPIGVDAGDLWKLLAAEEPRSGAGSAALDFAWLTILFVPAGFWLFRPRQLVIAVVAATAGLFAISQVTDLLPVSLIGLLGTYVGLVAGWSLRRSIQANARVSTSARTQRSMRV